MGLLVNTIKKIGSGAYKVATTTVEYVVKPIAAIVAGPIITWGIIDGVKIAAGKVGVDGLGLDAVKGLTSSAVTMLALQGLEKHPNIEASNTKIDEESALLVTDIKVEPKKLNAKGKVFIGVTATAIGTATTIGTAALMRTENFPNSLEDTNATQQELIAHYISTIAGSTATALTQYGLKWMTNKIAYFNHSLVDTEELHVGSIKKKGYLVLAPTDNENNNNASIQTVIEEDDASAKKPLGEAAPLLTLSTPPTYN